MFQLVGIVVILGLTGCMQAPSKQEEKVAVLDMEAKKIEPIEDMDYNKAALVNVELGLGYLNQGQVARAKSKLTYALKLAPSLPETHTALGYFFESVGEIKEAESHYRKAIKHAKNVGAVYNNFGAFLCRQSRYLEADKAFRLALEDKGYTRTAEVYENAGICALKAEEVAKAESYLQTAIRRDPKRANAIVELADLVFHKGETERASKLLAQYKQISEPSAKSLWLGIQIAERQGNKNGAASQGLLLKNRFPNSKEYQTYLEQHSEFRG